MMFFFTSGAALTWQTISTRSRPLLILVSLKLSPNIFMAWFTDDWLAAHMLIVAIYLRAATL